MDNDLIELFRVQLKSDEKQFKATGNTRHYANGELLPEPITLSIVQYKDGSGFYLFYLDETDNEQTDTYHDDLDSAFRQAEFEFDIKKSDWTKLN